jgi:lysophospholipase
LNTKPLTAPKLEERFLEPEGWRWHVMERGNRKIRFGFVFPKGRRPDLIVVCLPGLSEFCEKYFELARDCLDRNYAFWVIDWAGQGLSSRLLYEPGKRHSLGFDLDIEDLEAMIEKFVKHIMAKNNMQDVPLGMVAHSMGANIGLRYIKRNPDVFACAAFSAPMIGLHAFRMFPAKFALKVAQILNRYMSTSSIIGLKDWREDEKIGIDANPFTADKKRAAVHTAWCKQNPQLNAGLPTHGWLYEALLSCQELEHDLETRKIAVPCIIGYSGYENFVDNMKIQKANTMLKFARILEFEEGRHEILMEEDKVRGPFLKAFYDLIDKKILGIDEEGDSASNA